MSDTVLTVRQAAKRLSVSEKTLKRQIALGGVPGVFKIGPRTWRIHWETFLQGMIVGIDDDGKKS